MKTKIIFSVIAIAVLCMGTVNSQITPSVTRVSLSENDKAILNQHLSKYTAFTIDKRELIDRLYTNGKCQFQIHIDEKLNWTFDLEFNDMRAPDFRQTYITNEGMFEVEEPFIVNTFKGQTSKGQIVRFTIDENRFSGIILCDREHYAIRSVKDYTQNRADESLVIYKSSDIISKNKNVDYFNDEIVAFDSDKSENEEESTERGTTAYIPCTYYLKIATDADCDFYQKTGSNVINVYNSIFSMLNEVEGLYESTFNMKFIITYQNVWTSKPSGYPYTSSDTSTLLGQFKDYWNTYMGGINRNIAHLFSGDYYLNSWGKAYRGEISTPKAYSLSMIDDWYDQQYVTIAHEIGHNLNASHATPLPNDCRCESIFDEASIMCEMPGSNMWFCGQSLSEIIPFIKSKISVLGGSISTSLTLSGSLTGFQSYEATQTITSTQVVNSGLTSYKAGNSITLKPGFHAKAGSQFTATIGDITTDCNNLAPIVVASWTNIVCKGGQLRFNVANATGYSVKIWNLSPYSLRYEHNGRITGNPVIVWNASAPAGTYEINISFFSPVYEKSNAYYLLVADGVSPCNNKAPAMPETEDDEIALQKTLPDSQFDFHIYPNPNDGNFTLTIDAKEIQPFFMEIFDSSGMLLSKTEYCNVYQINVNHTGLPQGIYYVKLTMGSNVSTKKVVIQ